jgi:hypothetical protein
MLDVSSVGAIFGYSKHYGTVFRIEIIDATTDKAIGSSIVTTQGILQNQRDFLIEEKQMPYLYFLMHGPLKFDKVRRTVLELRTGLNENDFFNPSKQQQQISVSTTSQDNKTRPGTELLTNCYVMVL